METGEVHVVGKSTLRMSDGGVIHTNEGFFNQITGSARTVGHTTITSPERDIDGYNITFNNETGDAEGHQGVTINDKKAHRVIKGKDVWYNSNSGHMEGRGDVDIEDKQNDRTIADSMWSIMPQRARWRTMATPGLTTVGHSGSSRATRYYIM